MDALKNKNVGYAIAAVGVLLALAGAFADTLGIGAEDAEGMGGKQLALLLAGVVVLGAGLAVVFLSGPPSDGPTDEVVDVTTTDADADADEVVDVTTESTDDEDETAETEEPDSVEPDANPAEATD